MSMQVETGERVHAVGTVNQPMITSNRKILNGDFCRFAGGVNLLSEFKGFQISQLSQAIGQD